MLEPEGSEPGILGASAPAADSGARANLNQAPQRGATDFAVPRSHSLSLSFHFHPKGTCKEREAQSRRDFP